MGRLLLTLVLLLVISPAWNRADERGEVDARKWHEVQRNGALLWQSVSGEWRAEVDPGRGRLTYLGPDSGGNLLSHPPVNAFVSGWGAHRVWLGPVKLWPKLWPPPVQWEGMAARSVKVDDDGDLIVALSSGEGAILALQKKYGWSSRNGFHCSVSWSPHQTGPRQAVQVLQLNAPDSVMMQGKSTDDLPLGYKIFPQWNGKVPTIEFSKTAEGFRLVPQGNSGKIGFSPCDVIARWKGIQLVMHPGTWTGVVQERPDQNCLSQIYLGAKTAPLWEIEQLSPLLSSESDAEIIFRVEVELQRRAD